MKNLVSFIILLIFFVQCTSQKENEYFDKRYIKLNAKILKIEEKKSIFIYYFKSKNQYGIFAKDKICNTKIDSWNDIKINKNYQLILDLPINANSRSSGYRVSINGEFVWDSDMKEIYYDDCKNICGNRIYILK